MTVINTVYVLFNVDRNKIYIGKTIDLGKRTFELVQNPKTVTITNLGG